jgi:hypothetical protein
MKIKLFVLFFAISFMTACSSQTSSSTSNVPSTNSTTSNSSPALQAEVNSPVSVQLTWLPVDGAEKYVIEVSFGEDFFPIASLDAGQTSFEHFPIPENTELTYRLLAFSGSQKISETESQPISTPTIEPDPLTVQANAYQPISPLANMKMPVIDPNDPNFDPEALATQMAINPETGKIDPAALMGEPVNSVEEIDPGGGTVSVTAPDGITYTLIVPEGALQETTFITMTPIESIDDLPLENFLGAVDIQPDGLILDVPAMLTIDFPDAVEVPQGMVTMNFAYTGSGFDFHFVPYLESDILANTYPSSVGVLAKLAPRALGAGPLSGIALDQLGGRGVGNGTPAKIHSTVKKSSSSTRSSRRDNRAAAAQMDDDLAPLVDIPEELAPLIPDHLNQAAHEIAARISAVNTPAQLGAAISDFSSYFYQYGDLPMLKEINDKLWNQLVDKTYDVFKAHKDECITKDAFNIQAIASKMINAGAGFWKTFRERYSAREGGKGDALLKEIEKLLRKCKFEFDMDSNITLTVEKVTTHAHVNLTIPLELTFDPSGAATFKGSGSLHYLEPVKVAPPDCPDFLTSVKDLAGSKFEVWDLAPVFDENGKLIDFKMRSWDIHGSQDIFKGKCQDSVAAGQIMPGSSYQADVWGGVFTYSHAPGFPFEGWTVTDNNSKVGSSGIVGEKLYDWPSRKPTFGGLVNEITKIQVVKLP